MKTYKYVLACCLVLIVAMGCAKQDEKQAALERETAIAAAKVEQAEADLQAARQAELEYTYTQKAEFVTRMKAELAEMQAEMDRLNGKVDRTTGATRAEARKQLAAVRAQWTEAKRQLDLAESADESSWDKVRAGFKSAYLDLKKSYDNTRQWLSDKIEP
ncbi:MAG: hypothetical protein Q8O14_02825 [bacterium]|jgi:Skp family chaperone for outer membrane proteins|nr:hypothetical protein [bacterium]